VKPRPILLRMSLRQTLGMMLAELALLAGCGRSSPAGAPDATVQRDVASADTGGVSAAPDDVAAAPDRSIAFVDAPWGPEAANRDVAVSDGVPDVGVADTIGPAEVADARNVGDVGGSEDGGAEVCTKIY
jgi:hypothetical protein